ncbi:MAG: aminotransferase class I/II-fold pyridoxal phosphate-dependent enzyme [Planctomycetota bacterium]
MNPLAKELNETLEHAAPEVYRVLSKLGRELYFPKGILTQTAEAKHKAHRLNATIGIAKENGEAMHLKSVMLNFAGLQPDSVLPYASSYGLQELRILWSKDLIRKNPSLKDKSISLPIVTNGVTHGLSIVGDLFVEPGDAVLLPDKVWGNYNMTYGVRREADLLKYRFFNEAGGFDVAGLRRTLLEHAGRGKLVIVLNFPNNPTGYSVTRDEADGIARVLLDAAEAGCNIVAVCDDAYFGLFYDDECLKESLFCRLAGLHKRVLAIKLDGATKEDFVWGFRVGFITLAASPAAGVHEALEKKIGGAVRGAISNCPLVSQTIVLRAMSTASYEDEKKAKFDILRSRALKVREVLAQERYAEAWTPYPFNAGYFMCLRMKSVNAEEFRVRLLDQYGIGVISVGDTDIRVAFSCVEERDIPDLFDVMFQCAREMTQRKR